MKMQDLAPTPNPMRGQVVASRSSQLPPATEGHRVLHPLTSAVSSPPDWASWIAGVMMMLSAIAAAVLSWRGM